MSKNKIPEMPSIEEAVVIASIFDNAGYYDDANLMDSFIKQASNTDIEKQAGLWSGIWNRLGGWAKRVFFKEYRELYKIAKEANEQINKRFEEAQDMWKEAQSDFKNYELVAWREKVLQLPVFTKDLMVDYEKAFGRLVAFTYKLQEGEKKETGDISKITPPGEGGEGKPWGTPEEKRESGKWGKGWRIAETVEGKDGKRIPTIVVNNLIGDIAVASNRFKVLKNYQLINAEGQEDLYKINTDKKHVFKISKKVYSAFGDNVWKETKEEDGWVFLKKVSEKSETFESPEDSKIPESSEKPTEIGDPSLPEGLEGLTGLTEEAPTKIEEEKIVPETGEVELQPEKSKISPEETEMLKSEEPPTEGIQTPKGYSWVVLLTGKDAGKAVLKRKTKGAGYHWIIQDENLIKQLNEKLQKAKDLGVKLPHLEDPSGESYGVPKEAFEKAQAAAVERRERARKKVKKEKLPVSEETEEILSSANDMSLSTLFDSVMNN